jgi:hypothetical protein
MKSSARKPDACDCQFGCYRIEKGRFIWNKLTRKGDIAVTLTNFVAWISKELTLDNGVDSHRQFEIQGVLSDGRPLPAIRVTAASFQQMNWVVPKWGPQAIVAAGNAAKDRLREALQLYSVLRGIENRLLFSHTGWREVSGKWIFLNADCTEGGVELPTGLDLYRLPHICADVSTACRASLDFLQVAPFSITVPLLAVQYLAPLSEFLHPAFTLWIFGQSGTFKTTLAALALSHYGTFDTRNVPASWESTSNMLERLAFQAKDVPLIIDDFYPQTTKGEQRVLEEKIAHLVRSQGNLAARGRMKPDTSLRTSYPPRGIIIGTGEQLPNIGVSGLARLFQIEINSGMVDVKVLSKCQKQADLYPGAMRAYIDYLTPQIPAIKETLQDRFLELRSKLLENDMHYKVPEVVTWLVIGFECAVNFWKSVGAMNEIEAKDLLNMGCAALQGLGEAQAHTIQDQDPCDRFIETIATLLADHRIHFADRNTGDAPENAEACGWVLLNDNSDAIKYQVANQSELVGWVEEDAIYLIPEAAYRAVIKFCRDQGEPFVISKNEILRRLERKKILVAFPDGERTQTLRCGGINHRIAQIKMSALKI